MAVRQGRGRTTNGEDAAGAPRGLNVSIAEGLAIEREQFARMAATQDTREALDTWLAARASHARGLETRDSP